MVPLHGLQAGLVRTLVAELPLAPALHARKAMVRAKSSEFSNDLHLCVSCCLACIEMGVVCLVVSSTYCG